MARARARPGAVMVLTRGPCRAGSARLSLPSRPSGTLPGTSHALGHAPQGFPQDVISRVAGRCAYRPPSVTWRSPDTCTYAHMSICCRRRMRKSACVHTCLSCCNITLQPIRPPSGHHPANPSRPGERHLPAIPADRHGISAALQGRYVRLSRPYRGLIETHPSPSGHFYRQQIQRLIKKFAFLTFFACNHPCYGTLSSHTERNEGRQTDENDLRAGASRIASHGLA